MTGELTSRLGGSPQPQATVEAPSSLSALPLSDKRYRGLGVAILLLALGGFGGWATTADLAVAVVASGAVSVESFKKVVQHLEGGIVEQILVQDGDHVAAGDPLLILNKTQELSRLQIVRSQYLINQATKMRLRAEQQGADAMEFPDELLQSDLPQAKEVLDVQRALFIARREALDKTLGVLDEQIVQMREQIDGLQSMVRVNQSLRASLETEAKGLRKLFEKGMSNNVRLRELERQMLQLEGKSAQHRAEIARLKSRISENQVQKQLEAQEFQKEVGEQLHETEANIADAEERLVALGDQFKRTTVVAPVAGTVVGMKVHTLGAVIRPGDPIMDIVPSQDGFVVEARIADRDIDNIYPGQYAEIRFSAFNQRLTNVIDGRVTHVSADSFEDEVTGSRYYKARIKVTEEGRRDMTDGMKLLAGMPAEVMIKTGERTFASYVVKPIADMLARAMREG